MQLNTCYQSSPNIALVKYWGKYQQAYVLPINDSIGLTLSPDDFHTKTSISFSQSHPCDKLILNGKQHEINKRLLYVFKLIREKAYQMKYSSINKQEWEKYHFYVESQNSFPTASGMASSASGLACLASALDGLFGNILSQVELSELARFGSGSASRSVFGGLVKWKGVPKEFSLKKKICDEQQLENLSKQCISTCIRSQDKLKYIRIICLLATNKQKQMSSTEGMRLSVETSKLIKYRNENASRRINKIQKNLDQIDRARKQKASQIEHINYNQLCEHIIKDSNQFHAICLDTYPPIFYLNEFSKQIMEMVDQYINKNSDLHVAYSFDAGPHAFLFVHQDNYLEVFSYLQQTLLIQDEQLNQNARKIMANVSEKKIKHNFPKFKREPIKPYAMWTTQVGPGSMPYHKKQ